MIHLPIGLIATEAESLLLFGSTVSTVSKAMVAVVMRYLSRFCAFWLSVATNVETTVSPDARVEYSQAGVSGLIPLSQVKETRLSWFGKLWYTSTKMASSGPRLVMVIV